MVTSIAEFAFFYCDKIAAVVLPASLTTISNNAFYFCTSLRSLIVPESVTTIGAHAFAFCNLLNIYFEASEIQDGFDNDWNFSNCSYYFDAVKSTNDDGFEIVSYSTDEGTSAIVTGYSGSASTLTIPSSASNNQIKGIADYAFYNNETIKNVTIPKSVSYLGIGAFSGASNLETVSLEANIETINPYVFLNCTSLTSVSLAETITSIWIASFALPIAISLLILIQVYPSILLANMLSLTAFLQLLFLFLALLLILIAMLSYIAPNLVLLYCPLVSLQETILLVTAPLQLHLVFLLILLQAITIL